METRPTCIRLRCRFSLTLHYQKRLLNDRTDTGINSDLTLYVQPDLHIGWGEASGFTDSDYHNIRLNDKTDIGINSGLTLDVQPDLHIA